MVTIDRSTRRTPPSLVGTALGGLLALALAGCGATATSGPATPGASAAPAAAASAAPATAAASVAAPASAAASPAASAVGESGASGHVCDLVSAGEIQSLTGATSVTVLGGAGNASVCVWQLTPDGLVSVQVYAGSDAVAGAAVWAGFQANPSVPGVGSDARFDPSGTYLLVKVGAGYAQFSVILAAVADHKPATINLAKLVVPKLGG